MYITHIDIFINQELCKYCLNIYLFCVYVYTKAFICFKFKFKYVNIFFDSCQNFCLIFLKVIDLSVIAELFQKFKKNFSTFPISGFNFWCSFDRSPSFFFLQIKICCASTVCELIFLLSLNPVRTSDIYFSYILGLFQIHVLWKMPVS